MRDAFGKPVGVAARVRANQRLLEIWIEPGKIALGKKALKVAGAKMPSPCRIVAG